MEYEFPIRVTVAVGVNRHFLCGASGFEWKAYFFKTLHKALRLEAITSRLEQRLLLLIEASLVSAGNLDFQPASFLAMKTVAFDLAASVL